MPSVNDFYGSGATIKASDLQGREFALTISALEFRKFDDGNKIELTFAQTDKKMVCNKTNANTIADIYGDETNNWIGKEITLFPTYTDFNGGQVPCVRVKPMQAQAFQQQAPQQMQQQPAPNGGHPFAPQQPPQGNMTSEDALNDSVPF